MKEIEKKQEKNKKIKESLKETRKKRRSQFCRVYEMKIQLNKLNETQKEQLKRLFIEAKWLYNDILNWSKDKENNIFKYSITKTVKVRQKDKSFVEKELTTIGSQMKQSVYKQICSSIKSLSTQKKNGKKVGKLKFISEYTSIDLKQYGNTYKFYGNKHVHIQGIKGYLYINGIDQIKDDVEFANAKLVKRDNDYYLYVTTYTNKKPSIKSQKTDIGIDMGCQTSLTLSNGEKIDVKIEETEHLKRLQRKSFKQKKGSNNKHKTIVKIHKKYQKINNQKRDKTNKIINYLNINFNNIFIQDEQLVRWKENGHGKSVHHSILGRVKRKLKSQDNCFVVDKCEPTSKFCFDCGHKHENLSLYNREFICPFCGVKYDRDVHAAINILKFGSKLVPMEHREFMLSDSIPATVIADSSKV